MIPTSVYFLFSRALVRPHDPPRANHLRVTQVRPRLLASLGARFIISDRELDHPRLTLCVSETREMDPLSSWLLLGGLGIEDRGLWGRLHQTNGSRVVLRLYEIVEPNLGMYSPVTVHRVADARQAVQRMLSAEFDFREDVVLFQRVDAPLVTADQDRMSFERGGVRLTARSHGQSLLVLPLQFSHALRIVSPTGSSSDNVRIVRANLAQAGILFSGSIDVTIRHTFGLFRDIENRMADIEDCHRLGIVENVGRDTSNTSMLP